MKYRGHLTTKELIALVTNQEPNYVLFAKHVNKTIVGGFIICCWNEPSLNSCSKYQLFCMYEALQNYGEKTVGKRLFSASKMNVEKMLDNTK